MHFKSICLTLEINLILPGCTFSSDVGEGNIGASRAIIGLTIKKERMF